MESFQIGNNVKVINPKHKLFEYVGIVTKVLEGKSKVIFLGVGENPKSVTLRNEEIVKIPRDDLGYSLISEYKNKSYSEPPDRPKIIWKGKNVSLTKMISKAFPKKYFSELLLFHYMRPQHIKDLNAKFIGHMVIEKGITTSDELLDLKLRKKELVHSSGFNPCVYFTPIPRLLFKKYYLERFSTKYNGHAKTSFFCLDGNVLCKNLKSTSSSSSSKRKIWIGVNFCTWSQGPLKLYRDKGWDIYLTYILDDCDSEPEISEGFRDHFLRCLEIKILDTHFGGSSKSSYGVRGEFELENKEKFIEMIKLEGYECLAGSELFVCHIDWEKNKGATIKFSEEDILIKNYSGNSGYEEIKRVLKNGK